MLHGKPRFKLITVSIVHISDPLLPDFPILATCGKVAAQTLDHCANQPELFSRQLLKDALKPEGVGYTVHLYLCT